MARNTIKFQLKKSLEEKASYGRSKHDDKIATYEKRMEMKKQGYSYEERIVVNEMRDHIYSYQTMKTYQQQVGYFGEYLISQGLKKISIEESQEYIQEYINYLIEQNKSPWTINTALAAICKATGAYQHDYSHPSRSISHIDRGNHERTHDKYNEKNHSAIMEANRLLGLRRSELQELRAQDIFERNGQVIVQSIGKGGRRNEQIFTLEEEKQRVLALKAGKEPEQRIFEPKDFRNDCDLHSCRQQRAIEVYNRVVADMCQNPDRREYYQSEIERYFHDRGRSCRENLDNPYCVRGNNRQRLLAEGKEVSYDRTAILYVSTTVLSHTRSDVTVEHYIAKS